MDEVTFNEHTWTLENPWVVFNETHNQRKYSESLDRRSLTGTYTWIFSIISYLPFLRTCQCRWINKWSSSRMECLPNLPSPFDNTCQEHLKHRVSEKMAPFLGQRVVQTLGLWADESTFTRDGVFNTHNEHTWSLENPCVVFKKTRNQRKFSTEVALLVRISWLGNVPTFSRTWATCPSCGRVPMQM